MAEQIPTQPVQESAVETIDKWVTRLFPILLFLAAFWPRITTYVGSDTLWHSRARTFFDAFLGGRWAETYLAPHPGVITMWLAGLGREIALLFNPGFDGMAVHKRMAVELIPFALVLSIGLVLAYFILKRLFGFSAAAFSTLLLALEPYDISISKIIHVDALVTTFMLLSALLLWLFLKENRWRWILFSGLLAGLALLTKTSALFLVPYFFLSLLVWQAGIWWRQRQTAGGYDWLQGAAQILKASLIWLAAMVIIYFILWPAMWVQPLETLSQTWGGTLFYRKTPHENPMLFLGKVYTTDPGLLFYPVNLVVKTTAVTLIGFILSFFVLLRVSLLRYQRQAIALGMAFILFFIFMMTLGEKKQARYMLPALEMVTLLAGIGWVYSLRTIWRGKKGLLQVSLAFLLALQLLIVVPRSPYFGTHYNYLLGGPRRILGNDVVAGQEYSIGVEMAADYLNTFPLPTPLVVGAQNWLQFYHYFQGKTVPLTDDKVDYIVFTRNWIKRGTLADEWLPLWDAYRSREPKYVVSFDGIPYVWVYKTSPIVDDALITYPLDADIGQGVRLLGYDFSPKEVLPGEAVYLTLYWEALDSPLADYTVFTHLLDPEGQLQGQRDSQPQNGMYPTYLWDRGERIQDTYELFVDPRASSGTYDFSVGMYILETLERQPIVTSTGKELPERSLQFPGPRVLPQTSE
jgi:hypothetical protein